MKALISSLIFLLTCSSLASRNYSFGMVCYFQISTTEFPNAAQHMIYEYVPGLAKYGTYNWHSPYELEAVGTLAQHRVHQRIIAFNRVEAIALHELDFIA